MSFFTFEFFLFFLLVLILNWRLKRWPLIWRLFLLFSSYIFYSFWDFRFLLILIGVSCFNFFSGFLIYRLSFWRKKLTFTTAIIVNILVLGIFKYYDFFRASADLLLERLGLLIHFPLLEIILPIGLSFYIFRTISYNADIYLKKIKPADSFLNFLIYVAFFPHLLSGPIMRAGNFLSQLKGSGAKTSENLYGNISLILSGLFKKLVISSYLVVNLTDDVFAVPENHSNLFILLAILAYSLVIYFDFSGYNDLAVGFAGLMGFKSPTNFNAPYLSLNIKEFWRRWHITLGAWIRDYVYIPLGGNRKGRLIKYLNLMIALILIGFWHGAKLHFIIWGAMHGLALTFVHFRQDEKNKRILNNFSVKTKISSFAKTKRIAKDFISLIATFSFISFAWIFFRAETAYDALILIKSLFIFNGLEPLKIYILIVMAVGFFFFLFEKEIIKTLENIQRKLPTPLWLLFIIFLFLIIFKLSSDIIPSFIYFSF